MNTFIELGRHYPISVLFVSFIIGFFFMPIVVKIAKKHNFVVSPNKRTSHNGSIPNIGGVDIFISFLLTVFLFSFSKLPPSQFILFGFLIILIVGFIDDLIDIKVVPKLIGEFIGGFFLIVTADVRLVNLQGFLGIYELPLIVSYLFSFFAFIVVVNAVNLIDGIDGLASGLGTIYSLFFAIYFQLTHHISLSIVAYALAGSLIVFFYYNVISRRNKIFMGDSGSLLLGFMFYLFVALFCRMNYQHDLPEKYYMNAAPVVAFSVLTVPLFDTLRVMITRIKKGYSPFKADKNHVHHLILKLGFKHFQVTLILMGVSLFFIFIAILGRNLPGILLFLIVFVSCILLTEYLWRQINRENAKIENIERNSQEESL